MSLAQEAAAAGLSRVGARPPLLRYLAETWSRRDFLITMARLRLRSQFEKNRLGIVWLVLRPTINAAIYGLIFGFLQGDSRPPNYTSYVIIGVFLFEFFSKSLTDGSKSISGNRALVQSLSFPRLTLPLAKIIENFLSLMPMILVMFFYLIVLGSYPTVRWLLLVPLLAIYTVFNTGIALIAARLTVHIADLNQLLPFITRILFYTSGVLFAVDRVLASHPSLVALFDFHPIYQVLQIARSILMGQVDYDPMFWVYLSVWSVVVFVGGLIFFWSAEERYGRD